MRKIIRSFLPSLLPSTLFVIFFTKTNGQVPVFGPETFGTSTAISTGWTVNNPSNNNNTWEMINSIYPSISYSNPNASGNSHIKIDASASRDETLTSPVINCSGVTNGELRFGIWRAAGYTRTLVVSLDTNNDGLFTDAEYLFRPTDLTDIEEWKLIIIPLGIKIDNKPSIRIRLRHIGTFTTTGPLRIDDITLYGYTTTLPTDYFRTKASGNWNNTATWESSHDNVSWISATLTPTSIANTITIRNSHNVTNTSPVTVDQITVKNGSQLILAHNLTLNNGAGDDLTVEEEGTLDVGQYSITTAGSIQLNGHLKTANSEGLVGSTGSSVAAGVTLNALGVTSIIEYNSIGNQLVSILPNYTNLIISGVGNKTLTGSITVNNNLQLKGGMLVLEGHDLIVTGTATGSSTSYIKISGSGRLTINKINGMAKSFPIGNKSYNPITINNGNNLDWTVRVEDNWNISDVGLSASGNKAVHRTWFITPSTNPPPSTADIQFQYNDGDPDQLGADFDKAAPVQVWRKAGDNWLTAGITQLPAGAINGIRNVTISQDGHFSQFAISNMDTPLPVRFRDIRALQKQNTVLISFTNETEAGVVHYSIERSDDGQRFTSIIEKKPQKNNGLSAAYEGIDNSPLPLNNLYRIKAVERSGKVTYSSIVRVNIKEGLPRIVVVPNPATNGDVLLQLSNAAKDHYKLHLYNAKGQLLYQEDINHPGGSASYPLMVNDLKPGTYLIELKGKEKLLQRFVVL